jgi:hypothetical protein
LPIITIAPVELGGERGVADQICTSMDPCVHKRRRRVDPAVDGTDEFEE